MGNLHETEFCDIPLPFITGWMLRGDDKHSASRAEMELGNGWAWAESIPGVWEDGDFGAQQVHEKQ